jgi:hypothetical protein
LGDEDPVPDRRQAIGRNAGLGGVQGLEAVESGWRLRGFHNEQGVECVEIIVRALPANS